MTIATVRKYMTAGAHTIDVELTLAEARQRMFQLNARHLPVVDNQELVGILSERDIAIVESLLGATDEVHIRQAMTPRPFTCGPDAHLHAVAAEMALHKYGAAIIVDPDHPGHVLGMFTTTDALRALAEFSAH